ncbi:hypothetical protein E6W39_01125 [Kitasatospora acidiphila]|uniref:Uncharacterized protein n=1 Tax=Kitasatospora acidiphila TaxID=2567942 RepID=A0A540WG23_9ACTN|nr:hypothetical protein E6W39_01125 [Kitasatospora acidiphila]
MVPVPRDSPPVHVGGSWAPRSGCWQRAYYGANYDRSVRAKRTYEVSRVAARWPQSHLDAP